MCIVMTSAGLGYQGLQHVHSRSEVINHIIFVNYSETRKQFLRNF
jgi:hypothetical protein